MFYDWIREAERVACNNNRNDEQKIRFFGERLRGDAAECHSNFLASNAQHNNYAEWKTLLTSTFQDDNDTEK